MSLCVHWSEQMISEAMQSIQDANTTSDVDAILRLLKMVYFLEFGECGSKEDVVNYALKIVPQKWHPIIHGASMNQITLDEQTLQFIKAFMTYTIQWCNEKYHLFHWRN